MNVKHLRENHIHLSKTKPQILYQKKYHQYISQHHIQYVIEKYHLYFDPQKAQKIRSKKESCRGTKKTRINEVNPKEYLTFNKPFFFCCDTIVIYLSYNIKDTS